MNEDVIDLVIFVKPYSQTHKLSEKIAFILLH